MPDGRCVRADPAPRLPAVRSEGCRHEGQRAARVIANAPTSDTAGAFVRRRHRSGTCPGISAQPVPSHTGALDSASGNGRSGCMPPAVLCAR